MTFNDTIYKTFKVVNFATFAFFLAIGLDFILPKVISEEVIVGSERRVDYRLGSRYKAGGVMASDDTNYLKTENFRFQIDRAPKFNIQEHDTVKIYQGLLSRMILGACLTNQAFEKPIERSSTVWGNLSFVPIVAFLTSLSGVLFHRKNVLTVETGAMSLLLVAIFIYLVK